MSVSQQQRQHHPIPRLLQQGGSSFFSTSRHQLQLQHQHQHQQHQHLLQLHLGSSGIASAVAMDNNNNNNGSSASSSCLAVDLNGYDQAIQDLTESLNEVRLTASLALQESQLVREQMQQGILSVLSELTAMWCQDICPQAQQQQQHQQTAAAAVDFVESIAGGGAIGLVRSPDGHQQQQDQRTNFRYKTQLCKNFMAEGGTGSGCTKGDTCQYAHGRQELRRISEHPRYKTKMCSLQASLGVCPHGAACFFAHHSAELRAKEV